MRENGLRSYKARIFSPPSLSRSKFLIKTFKRHLLCVEDVASIVAHCIFLSLSLIHSHSSWSIHSNHFCTDLSFKLRLFDVCFTLTFLHKMLSSFINSMLTSDTEQECVFVCESFLSAAAFFCTPSYLYVSVQVLCRFQLHWHMQPKCLMHTRYRCCGGTQTRALTYKIPLTI